MSLLEINREIDARKPTETPDEDPLFESFSFGSLDGEVDGQTEERVSKAVVRSGFGGYDVSQSRRHVL